MKRINWIFFVALRYLRTRSLNRLLGPSVLAVTGIAVGVMALVSVLGVMNGFQLGFIEDIININSFHIRVYSGRTEMNTETLEILNQIDGVKSVLPFMDIQTLIKGEFSDYQAVVVRAVPGNIRDYDTEMAEQLNIFTGSTELTDSKSIVLGNQLASRLRTGVGESISLVGMEGTSFKSLVPADRVFEVSALFKSGFYEFDSTMSFTIIENAGLLASGKENIVYGIKLIDRYNDKSIAELISKTLGSSYDVVSWREFNSSFFGALRTEKTAMMLIIGLIFIVVGVNIKHALDKSVFEKKEEIGIMMSLGATSFSIKLVFVFEGLMIGFTGGITGLVSGLLITSNINSIFKFVDLLIEKAAIFLQVLISPFTGRELTIVHMFSPVNYYITEVPVRIIYSEILFVFIFAVASSTLAAYSASKKVSLFKPVEVLRYE